MSNSKTSCVRLANLHHLLVLPIMQLTFAATAKRVIKMTGKAKAALEEKTIRTSSKKRKTDSNSGDSGNTNPKKAKKTLLPGNTPTDGAGTTDEDEPVDKNRPVIASLTASLSPRPESVLSRRAVVRTEEEENALYKDKDNADTDNDNTVLSADNEADETAEDELSKCNNLDINIILIKYKTERVMKDWNSPVYAFFDPTPQIVEIDGRRAHDFKCQAKRCKTKVRRYLDKGDARSTGNMRKHVCLCWGDEVLKAADEAKDANEVRQQIVGSFLRNGSITASFERKGKGKVTYSHRQHTRVETRYEQSLIRVLGC